MRANESTCKHYMSDLPTIALTITLLVLVLTEYISAGFSCVVSLYAIACACMLAIK